MANMKNAKKKIKVIAKKKKNNKSEYGEILNAENRAQNINEITDKAKYLIFYVPK